VLQITHGWGEHAGRYARVAETLCRDGYAVCANDHRGHGRTARTPAELGEPARTAFDWLSRDPDEVDRYIADPLCGGCESTVQLYIDILSALLVGWQSPAR
jgi:alpha-beta hydrolase superfamily lysophospholipase